MRGEDIGRKTQSLKEAFVFSFLLSLPSFIPPSYLSLHPPLHPTPPLPSSFSQTEVGAADKLLEQTVACDLRCQALEINSLMLSPLPVELDFILSIPHLERSQCLSPSKAS